MLDLLNKVAGSLGEAYVADAKRLAFQCGYIDFLLTYSTVLGILWIVGAVLFIITTWPEKKSSIRDIFPALKTKLWRLSFAVGLVAQIVIGSLSIYWIHDTIEWTAENEVQAIALVNIDADTFYPMLVVIEKGNPFSKDPIAKLMLIFLFGSFASLCFFPIGFFPTYGLGLLIQFVKEDP